MPNTLVHLCIQTPASQVLFREADTKWIAIGCIIPDIPWILQRIIPAIFSNINLIDLRIYTIIQASLFFCLLLCLALSILASNRGGVFLLLSLNCLLHLLLDAMQIKWANGVHFLAPVSWQMTSFSLLWPENRAIILLSGLGLGALIYFGYMDRNKPVKLSGMKKNRITALLIIISYFVLPFPILQGPETENNHYVATLRNKEERPGKYIEFDRAVFRSNDNTARIFSGERLKVKGNLPLKDGKISVRGDFVDVETLEVTSFHAHSIFRDIASITALSIIVLIWLIAMARKRITIEVPHP